MFEHPLLHTAILYQREKIVQCLLGLSSTNVNYKVNSCSHTPLAFACGARYSVGPQKCMVQLLLQHANIDVNVNLGLSRGGNGGTAIHYVSSAWEFGHVDYSECLGIFDLLISDDRTNVNKEESSCGGTLLMEVVKRHGTPRGQHQEQLILRKFLKILLDCPRVDVNKTHRFSGETALMMAFCMNNIDFVKALLACDRIDVNQVNEYGETILFYISHWVRSDHESWGDYDEAFLEEYGPVPWTINVDMIKAVFEDERLLFCHRDNDGRNIWDYLTQTETNRLEEYQLKRVDKAEQQIAALHEEFDWPEGLLETHVKPFLFIYI